MKNIILIVFLLIELLWSQNSAYKNFQSYMSIAGGRILNIHFYQEQSGSYFESDGLLYYFSDIHYAFDMKDQRITYNNDMITTINKTTKQIIYDMNIENDISVLDILKVHYNIIIKQKISAYQHSIYKLTIYSLSLISPLFSKVQNRISPERRGKTYSCV